MKRYSEYKDSGVKWIGEIPGHWECRKLKFLTSSMQSGDNLTAIQIKEIGKYPVYGGNGIRGYYDESNCNKQCIVIGRQGALCGNVHIVKEPFWATDHAVVTYANENTNLDFLFYLTRAMNLNQYAFQTAAQPGIAVSAIKNIYTCYPPLPEQEAIVTYLDTKVAKIDEYISIAEKKIAALEELKQTIIAEAVTRGIHKDVPMKDSGVKWIGMIPEHWKMNSLRSYVKLYSEKNHPEKQLLSVTREMGVIVRNTESKEENHNFIPDDLSGYKLVRKGDFVINKMKSWQGSYGVSKYEGIVSPAYYVCKLKFPYNDFFSIAIRCKSYVPFFTQYSKGIRVDQWDLSPIALKNIPFMEPPITEQQEIVSYIDSKAAKIDQLCQAERSQIDNLKEYKQRLISDVVTGKVKVTND